MGSTQLPRGACFPSLIRNEQRARETEEEEIGLEHPEEVCLMKDEKDHSAGEGKIVAFSSLAPLSQFWLLFYLFLDLSH